jgi:phage-related protein
MAATIGRTLKRAALGAIAVVTGLTAAVMKLAGSLDDLAKESRRLDFPVEALQEWRFAAEQSGVSNELFSKSIQAFNKRLGEAKIGSGALVTILKKYDKNLLKQLQNTKDTAEAFEIYTEAIRKVPDTSVKAALAAAAFSRAGLKMINITHSSTAELKALREEQRQNGIATAEQVVKAEALIDAMNSLKRAGMGLIQTVLAPMMPMMTQIARRMRVWINANREMIATKIKEWGQFIVDNWREIVDWAKKIGKAIGVFFALHLALKLIVGVLTVINALMAVNPIGLLIIAISALIGAIVYLVKNWDEATLAMRATVGTVATFFRDQWTKVGNFFRSTWNGLVAFFQTIWDTITGVFTAAFDKFSKAFPNLAKSFVKTFEVIKNIFRSIGRFFADIWRGMMDTVSAFTEFFKDEIQAVNNFFISIWEGISGFFTGLWDGIADAFWGFIDQIKKGLKLIGELFGIASGKFQKDFEKNLKTQMEVSPLEVIPERGGIKDRFKSEIEIARVMEMSGRDRAFALDVLKRRDRMLKEQAALEQRKLGAMQSSELFRGDISLQQTAKKSLNVQNEILEQTKVGNKAQIDAINMQGVKTRGALGKSARDMARAISQRYIDVTAPYAHFLRAAEPDFKPGETSSSPQERATRRLIESRESSTAEVTIKDETKRAEVTSGKLAGNIQLERTGTF